MDQVCEGQVEVTAGEYHVESTDGLVLSPAVTWMQGWPGLLPDIKCLGTWRELWREACLTLTVPSDPWVMVQKARSSVQEYIRSTSRVRMLQLICAT